MKIVICVLFIFASIAQAEVTLSEFKNLEAIFHKEYDLELAKNNQKLIINHTAPMGDPELWWKLPNVQASYSSFIDLTGQRTHYLYLFGGYARLEGMTIEGVANTLCHELGHGIGGAPFKDKIENYTVSTEGQADYFATRFCLRRILKHLPFKYPQGGFDPYTDLKCESHFKSNEDKLMCKRSFFALESERIFFEQQAEVGSKTFFDRPDTSIAKTLNTTPTFYPNNQCRLDTMMNGILNLNRPRCWMP